ncbi:MAG: CPBP family intramembrane metalloprotease [Clostridia bacterium]|nr:CPBP family intramembrane metalloprotease [Clostridia bacterium]
MDKNENPQSGRNYQLPLGSAAGGLSFSATVVINLLVSIIGTVIITVGSLKGTDAAKYISVLVSPIAIAVTLALALKVVKQPARAILPVKTHPKYYLIGVLLIFGLLFSLLYANEYLIKLFELMGYKRRPPFTPDVSGWKVVPALLAIAVIPAVMEEILFRGILLNNTEEGAGSVRAILLSGFCFALYHGSVEQTIYQFICGCLFAFLAVRSRSVAPTVVIHFLNNAVIIVLMACGLIDESGMLIMPKTAEIIVSVLSAVSLIGAVVWLILDKKELKICETGGVRQFFIFAAVGIGATVIIWITGLF